MPSRLEHHSREPIEKTESKVIIRRDTGQRPDNSSPALIPARPSTQAWRSKAAL